MQTRDKITVLMPCHANHRYLDQAISSILHQSLHDFELLIVDDTPASNLYIPCTGDPRIRVISSKGKGLVAALNVGLQSSASPWVARMDSDDISHPQRLALQLDYMRHHDVSILGSQVEIFDDEGELSGGYQYYQNWLNTHDSPESIVNGIFKECPLAHPSFFMRRQHIVALGMYKEGPWPEDYELLLRLNHHGKKMASLQQVLLRWRTHDKRTSKCDERYQAARFQQLKAFYLAKRLRGANRAIGIWGAGTSGKRLKRELEKHGITINSFYDVGENIIGRHRGGVIVKDYRVLAQAQGELILIAVQARGVSQRISNWLRQYGMVPGSDFIDVS